MSWFLLNGWFCFSSNYRLTSETMSVTFSIMFSIESFIKQQRGKQKKNKKLARGDVPKKEAGLTFKTTGC